MQQSGKILKLQIQAFKGLQNFEINWEEGYAILGVKGDWGQGKSSLVEFVEACATGIVPPEAINTATKNAKGSLIFEKNGEMYTIDISKTKKSETVKIKTEKGMSGGKEVIRDLVGPVNFSPFSLAKMDPEEQVNEFKKIFNVNTKPLELARQKIYDERTIINRQITQIKNWLNQQKVVLDDPAFQAKLEKHKEPKDPAILEDLNKKLTAALEINQKRFENETLLKSRQENKQRLENDIKELERQIQVKKEELFIIDKEIEPIQQYIATNPAQDEEILKIRGEIKEIEDYNADRNELVGILAEVKKMDAHAKESKEKTEQLQAKDIEIQDFIKKGIPELKDIVMREPVKNDEGVITDDRHGLYWRDKPIGILSKTERITFGMELRQQINPEGIPILIFDDFESVGSLGREALDEMAEKGWQAIIAEVDPEQSNLKVVLKNKVADPNAKDITPKKKEEPKV